jgi:L-2-hydroxyglutarate oxidase LhgO
LQGEKCEVLIIGAGVIGCAIANELASAGMNVVVLEQGARIADGVTSRNSGVIHSGIYYPPQSLKAQTCVEGQTLLVKWCKAKAVPFEQMGKWIVGAAEDEAALESLRQNALRSGATGLGEVQKLAMAGVSATLGFFAQKSGIVDPYELSRSLRLSAEDKDALFVLEAKVQQIERLPNNNYLVHSSRGIIETSVAYNW